MKNKLIIASLFLMLLIVTSCSPSPKDEAGMISDLQNSPDFYSVREVRIDDLSIIKRQTNEENKEDIVFVDVKASSNLISCSLTYELIYILYNDGWLLETVLPYNEDEWVVTPLVEPDQSRADSLVAEEYGDCKFLEKKIDLDNGTCIFSYEAKRNYKYMEQIINVTAGYTFDSSVTKWNGPNISHMPVEGKWDNLEGIWVTFLGREPYYKMDITSMVDNEIVAEITRLYNGDSYHATATIDSIHGGSFEIFDGYEESFHGYYYTKVYITPDKIYINDTPTQHASSNFIFQRN